MPYTTDQIGGFYKQYLGRDLQNPGEAQGWLDNPDAESMIKGSGEAQDYAKKGTAGTPWSGTPDGSAQAGQTQTQTQTGQTGQTQAQPGAPPGQYTPAQIAAHKLAGMDIGPGTYDRGALSQAFQQKQFSGSKDIALPDFLKSLGGLAGGVTMVGSDKIRLPDGEVVDVIQDVNNGHGGAWWGSEKDWSADEAAGKHAGMPSGGGGGGDSGAGGVSGDPAGGGRGGGVGGGLNAKQDELYNMLMGRAKQGLNINAQTDPNIRQQADPYAAAVERERRRYMGDTAERMGPLANIQGEERLSSEKAGQAGGLFESQLIGREMQARRDEIAQALNGMQGMLSQEQQLAMQKELAQLDAGIRNRQISSGNDQFMGSLGLQAENQNNYWDAVRQGLL